MLFKLANNTPIFQVFTLLNEELCNFIGNCDSLTPFDRNIFSVGDIGKACWENPKTRESFEDLHSCLVSKPSISTQLRDCILNNQDIALLFQSPPSGFLDFLDQNVRDSLKALATQLYDHTKGLRPVEVAAGNCSIGQHFAKYRSDSVNGNVCKACGMQELAALRAGLAPGDQWRGDYDHQLCKTKYPIYAVHPQNLVPLCTVCNRDAKKAKDLFKLVAGVPRKAFFPYTEEACDFIKISLMKEKDPSPEVAIEWNTTDPDSLEKLGTWDDVYQIQARILGEFRSIGIVLLDALDPCDEDDFKLRVGHCANPVDAGTLKRKPYAFWNHKLCEALNLQDLEPFWKMVEFAREGGETSGDYILDRP